MADAVSIGKLIADVELGEDGDVCTILRMPTGAVSSAAGYADTEYFDADVIDIAFSSRQANALRSGMGVVFDERALILEAE